MYKTPTRHHKHNHSEYDIYGDLAKIKSALADVTYDATGKAKEVFTHSLDEVREKSATVQENLGSYIAEKPFKAVGIALFAGWFIGRFLRK